MNDDQTEEEKGPFELHDAIAELRAEKALAAPICSAPAEAVGPLNLNTNVRFKMKPRGVELARQHWESCGCEFPNAAFPVDQPDTECRQQMHEVFRIFGGDAMQCDIDGSSIYDLIIEPMWK